MSAAPQGSLFTASTLSARRNDIVTASEAPIILGLKKWMSPNQLLMEKVRRKLGLSAFKGNAATDFGNENEDFAKEEYQKQTFDLINWDAGTYEHSNGWLGATPDGFALDGTMVYELKCPYRNVDQYYNGTTFNKYFESYKPQMVVQMYVTGAKKAEFIVYDGFRHQIINTKQFDFDQAEWDIMEPQLKAFYDKFQQALDDSTDFEGLDLAERYIEAKKLEDEAKAKVEVIKAEMLKFVGNKEAVVGDVVITKQERISLDYKQFIADNSLDVGSEYKSVSSSLTFRINKPKKSA